MIVEFFFHGYLSPQVTKRKTYFFPCLFISHTKDTFLADEDMNKLLARFTKSNPSSITEKIVNRGLLQAIGFLELVLCPELVLECRNRYDVTHRFLRTYIGEVIVYINRVKIMGALRILPHEVYEGWMIDFSNI